MPQNDQHANTADDGREHMQANTTNSASSHSSTRATAQASQTQGVLFARALLCPTASARPTSAPPLPASRAPRLAVAPVVCPFSAASARPFATSGPLPDTNGRDVSFELRQAKDYFPYGNADFAEIRTKKHFFVDNTAAVREAAEQKHAILLRPPRFGKSLLLSAMQSYYDLASKDKFDALFGGLKAAEGEDEQRSNFHVLKLDLSLPVRANSDITAMEVLLNNRVNQAVGSTAERYELKVTVNESDCTVSLLNFAAAVGKAKNVNSRRLLVLIDEYDRYANKLMFEAPAAYAKLVRGISGQPASSPIRSLFETLKSIGGLDQYRTFTTGIAPVALADASGANHMEDMTFMPLFADTFGFTETDIVRALNNIGQTNGDAQQHILQLMRTYYNGYRFAESDRLVYNTTLSLFFLKRYHTVPSFRQAVHLWVPGGPLNVPLLDSNVRISESMVEVAKQTRVMPALCDQLLSNDDIEYSGKQISGAIKSSDLFSQFDFSDVARATAARDHTRRNVLSFMYYHGMVTFSGAADPAAATLRLKVPNLLVRQNMFETLDACLVGHYGLVRTMLREPSADSVRACLEQSIRSTQTPMGKFFSEEGLQKSLEAQFVLVLLAHGGDFAVRIFDGDGVEKGKLRPDMVLLPTNGKLLVHIELKFIKPHLLVPPEHAYPDSVKGLRDQEQMKSFAELIRMQSMEERREWHYHDYKLGWRSVAELERDTRAKTEKDYLGLLRDTYEGRKIYSFTAIVMGDSAVVSQVEPKRDE